MSFKISSETNNGYPFYDISFCLVDVLTPTYPMGMFSQQDGSFPVYEDNSSKMVTIISSPFPVGIYVQSAGEYPMYTSNQLVPVGICAGCTNLSSVIIPRSVKKISDYSFWNTSLAKVTISPDCVYFEHSFPRDCIVSYFKE